MRGYRRATRASSDVTWEIANSVKWMALKDFMPDLAQIHQHPATLPQLQHPALTPTGQDHFNRLPSEVRLMIYGYLAPLGEKLGLRERSGLANLKPAFLDTCRYIRDEALPELFKANSVYWFFPSRYNEDKPFAKFVDNVLIPLTEDFGTDLFKELRIEFESNSLWKEVPKFVDLARACYETGLEMKVIDEGLEETEDGVNDLSQLKQQGYRVFVSVKGNARLAQQAVESMLGLGHECKVKRWKPSGFKKAIDAKVIKLLSHGPGRKAAGYVPSYLKRKGVTQSKFARDIAARKATLSDEDDDLSIGDVTPVQATPNTRHFSVKRQLSQPQALNAPMTAAPPAKANRPDSALPMYPPRGHQYGVPRRGSTWQPPAATHHYFEPPPIPAGFHPGFQPSFQGSGSVVMGNAPPPSHRGGVSKIRPEPFNQAHLPTGFPIDNLPYQLAPAHASPNVTAPNASPAYRTFNQTQPAYGLTPSIYSPPFPLFAGAPEAHGFAVPRVPYRHDTGGVSDPSLHNVRYPMVEPYRPHLARDRNAIDTPAAGPRLRVHGMASAGASVEEGAIPIGYGDKSHGEHSELLRALRGGAISHFDAANGGGY